MTAQAAPAAQTVWCTEFELSHELRGTIESPLPAATEARVLVRFHGEPLEFVQLPVEDARVSVNALLARLSADARTRLDAHLRMDGVSESDSGSLPTGPLECRHVVDTSVRVSVVVCTRDRGPEIHECLMRLKTLKYDNLDIIIVDNAPSNDATYRAFVAEVGTDERFRYVLEPRPGLSCARNRGLAEATGEIIAYTDDDVRVDQGWVTALVGGFERRPDIACVTSLVCTASLQTPAEHYFDGKVSWAASCEPRIYDLQTETDDPLYPYAPGLFGTGAGMAFKLDTLRELGGFDEALGAGTRTAGGEDLDIFVRVLLAGHALAYDPASLVWHHHRSDIEGLRRQMFGYGSGLTAYVTKHLLDRTSRRALISRIPRGVAHMTTIARSSQKTGSAAAAVPARSLLMRELAGMASGPFLYAAARRQVTSTAGSSGSSTAPVEPCGKAA
jgi:GT2 family glycosyltransferase